MKLLELSKKTRLLFVAYCVMVVCFCFTTPVHADNDPVQVVNNLSDSTFGLIRVIGIILLGFGVVRVDLSLRNYDPSQRANGFLTVTEGIVITSAREILNIIVRG